MLESHYYKDMIEAGCDEAGRGCLAGSVYAAAVILPPNYQNADLNDSKKLTDKKRKALREQIERDAVAWAVGVVTPEEIDQINILNASFLAMHRALDQLKVRPEAVIVDGNRFKPYQDLPYTTIVKGDGKYLAIAAASILALLLTKKPDSIDGSHLFHAVTGEFLLVLGNVVHTERRDIIDGFSQTVGSYIIRSTSLKLERQLLESGLLEAYTLNHFATSLVWRQLLQPFFLAVKHADTGRTIYLMSAKGKEVAV